MNDKDPAKVGEDAVLDQIDAALASSPPSGTVPSPEEVTAGVVAFLRRQGSHLEAGWIERGKHLPPSPLPEAPTPPEPDDLGRFGHHPDPVTDYEVEVDAIVGMEADVKAGLEKREHLASRVNCALGFRVGGVESAISARKVLNEVAERLATPPSAEAAEAPEMCAHTEGLAASPSPPSEPTVLTDEAVDAAAAVLADRAGFPWAIQDEEVRWVWRNDAKNALRAAIPFMGRKPATTEKERR
jgi:hypothetical protein